MENLKSAESSVGKPGAKNKIPVGLKNILGGTVLALAAALGNTGCNDHVVIGEGNLLPDQDAGNDVVVIDSSNDQTGDEADAGNDGNGDESDASPDSDAAENDAGEACNTVTIFKSDEIYPSGEVANGATNIRLLCFDLYSGCQTGDLTELHFSEDGVNNGRMKVYVAESSPQGARLSGIRAGGDANFEGMKLPVENYYTSGKYSSYCLYGNLEKNAMPSHTYSYNLDKPYSTFMTNHPKIIMNSPVEGDTFVVGSTNTGSIKAEEAASVPLVTLEHGKHGHIGVIALEQGASAAGHWRRASLKFGGSCNLSTIKNLTLSEGNVQLSPMIGSVNEAGMVHFPILNYPYNLPPGGGSTLYIDADQNCNPGETIWIYLDEPSDLFVEDVTYGSGETVEGNFCGSGSGCKPSIVGIN